MALTAAIAAVVTTGCESIVSTTPDTPRVAVTPPPISGRIVTDTMAAEATLEAVKHFNVRLTSTGTGPAEAVCHGIEGRLAEAGYKMSADSPDVIVKLSVRSAEFDRSGGYVRYEGTVEASIARAWDGKKLGFQPFSARGKRGLGEDEATRNLTAQLADAAAPFIVNAARPELTGLSAHDVTIKRPRLTERDVDYPAKFINYAKSQKGVVYCAMVAEDYENRVMTFRVIYLADSMPEGLINRLAANPHLYIKPRN